VAAKGFSVIFTIPERAALCIADTARSVGRFGVKGLLQFPVSRKGLEIAQRD